MPNQAVQRSCLYLDWPTASAKHLADPLPRYNLRIPVRTQSRQGAALLRTKSSPATDRNRIVVYFQLASCDNSQAYPHFQIRHSIFSTKPAQCHERVGRYVRDVAPSQRDAYYPRSNGTLPSTIDLSFRLALPLQSIRCVITSVGDSSLYVRNTSAALFSW